MKKLLMTTLCAMGLIVCAASLTAESGAKSGSEAAPADTTYTVRGVNFTMKGIAAAAGSTMRLALLVPFGAVVVRGTATAFLACGWHAVCIRQEIR